MSLLTKYLKLLPPVDTSGTAVHDISYSSVKSLTGCPRRYQMNCTTFGNSVRETSTAMAFGTAYGIGVQTYMATLNKDKAKLSAMLAWEYPFEDGDLAKHHTIECLLDALDITINSGHLDEYELLELDGFPAVELSFAITATSTEGKPYVFRGFIDCGLRHKVTKVATVLEIKTTGSTWVHEALYGNSAQCNAYSTVLDNIMPVTNYAVLVLVYGTKTKQVYKFLIEKTVKHKVEFITYYMNAMNAIDTYSTIGFPMNGDNCMAYNRPCTYYGICDSIPDVINLLPSSYNPEKFMYNFTLDSIIQRQLDKTESETYN